MIGTNDLKLMMVVGTIEADLFNALKTLKLNCLYYERIDDIFTPQQRMLQFLHG